MLELGLLDHLKIKDILHHFQFRLIILQVKALLVPRIWFSTEIDVQLEAFLVKEIKLNAINLFQNTEAKVLLQDHLFIN